MVTHATLDQVKRDGKNDWIRENRELKLTSKTALAKPLQWSPTVDLPRSQVELSWRNSAQYDQNFYSSRISDSSLKKSKLFNIVNICF